MASLGFVMTSSNQIISGERTLEQLRRIYPDSYCIILGVGGEHDYYQLSKKYNTEYFEPNKKLGYPKEPFGWRKSDVLEFLDKFYLAFSRTDTTHMMYLEEDVLVLKKLILYENIEILGYKTCYPDGSKFENGFPDKFIKMIEEFSGVKPNVNGYGAGGGTVMKVKTFLENYEKVRSYIERNIDYIQDNVYTKAGWIDCFLTWYYLLCGKKYTFNPLFSEVGNDFRVENAPIYMEVASGNKTLYTKDYMQMRNQ
jgi:hypothetical protein